MDHRRPDSRGPDRTLRRSLARRDFVRTAVSGTVVTALGGAAYVLSDGLTRQARAQTRGDGRARLPPGQRVIEALKPMGGRPGNPNRADLRLRIGGEVEHPLDLAFEDLLAMNVVTQRSDVHCVTGWSVLGAKWKGVRVKDLAERAGVKDTARHVIFEAAHGYTANVRLAEGLADDVLVTWELDGRPLRRPHGAPLRALIPDLYFWKSAKFLTGITFVRRDAPGYWEVRGYHNHADPWKEERYA